MLKWFSERGVLGLWLAIGLWLGCPLPEARGQPQQDIVAMYLFQGRDEATWREDLERRTELQMQRIASVIQLDDQQQKKLQLALKGDFSRFYRELFTVRQNTKGLVIQNQADQQKAWQEIMPLYNRYHTSGVLGENSLFKKVLGDVLTDEQTLLYEEYLRSRNEFLIDAATKMTIIEIEKGIPLTAEQRQQLLAVVANEQKPVEVPTNQATSVGFVMLCRLDEEELAFLDEAQRKAFLEMLQPYRGSVRSFRW